jgi:hypothetical protein
VSREERYGVPYVVERGLALLPEYQNDKCQSCEHFPERLKIEYGK